MKSVSPHEYQNHYKPEEEQFAISRVHENAAEFLGIHAGDRVLDLGCGHGQICAVAERRGARCVGVDYIPELLEIARANAPKSKFVLGNVEEFSIAPEPFDKITLLGVIGYLGERDLASLFRNCFRMLAPGGKMLIRHKPPLAKVGDLYVKWRLKKQKLLYRTYGRRYVREVLAEAGFSVENVWLSLDRDLKSTKDVLIHLLFPFFAVEYYLVQKPTSQ